MKKTRRTLLSILLVLTLLASLPLTALAEEEHLKVGEGKGEDSSNYESNGNDDVIVDSGVTVGTNTGNVVTNNGTITNNGTENCGPESGTVNTNNGEIQNNYGTVGTNEAGAKVVLNDGRIGENRGEVAINGRPSVDSSEEGNDEPAVVRKNSGTVQFNRDIVENINGGVVTENYGLVNNAAGGVVDYNDDLGTVNNEAGGKVEENIGIVNNKAGGLLNDVFLTKNPESTNQSDYYRKRYEEFTGEAATYVGTELEVGWIETTNEETGEKTYRDFEDDGICNIVKQAIQDTVLNLKELGKLFQKDDYEVVGYQEYSRASDAAESSADKPVKYQTMYKVQDPDIWLNLIWGKAVIKPVASPAGDEAVPTSYNPNYIGLGSVIFINEKGYKVVEIKDDAYVVVTFDALPDEDVADLNALYAKLFTPEQQKLVKNMGQLLDSEDVLTIFGKPGNHPVFEFQKDLVK